ncbi:MAG: biopolymer transporter ExbD [Candidatus Eisenbacteria bacterium]|uniref:Biopolymer transporter ExbD n=1 Tax=Eiseniibacteriota bacterium TaxID=2212470 RepID=A0A937XDU4_UNCEI|nr:biopolymer transporter ExbD [Candidatus Eisenbacteria bacterium]
MRFTKRRRSITRFELTAMTDVVFLLMIFFLLTSSFVVHAGLRVQLPQVVQADPQGQRDIVVTLGAEDELLIDGVRIPWSQLRETLAQRIEASATKAVIVKGDEAARLGRTVQVMDLARQLGATQLAIAARPQAPPGGGARAR